MTVGQSGTLAEDEPMMIDQTNAETLLDGVDGVPQNDYESYCEK